MEILGDLAYIIDGSYFADHDPNLPITRIHRRMLAVQHTAPSIHYGTGSGVLFVVF